MCPRDRRIKRRYCSGDGGGGGGGGDDGGDGGDGGDGDGGGDGGGGGGGAGGGGGNFLSKMPCSTYLITRRALKKAVASDAVWSR